MRPFAFRSVLPAAALVAGLACSPAQNAAPTATPLLVEFDRAAPPDTVRDYPGFQAKLYHEGRLYIAGQPTEAALRALPAHGVTAVVNLRTPREMNNRDIVPFDEAAVLAELGIEYIWIPLGGDEHPYTPAAVDSFAAVLGRHRGPLLLHCTVAWRASYMWAAYLVRHQGMPVAEAYARGEAIGIGEMPIAGLLGRKLAVIAAE